MENGQFTKLSTHWGSFITLGSVWGNLDTVGLLGLFEIMGK